MAVQSVEEPTLPRLVPNPITSKRMTIKIKMANAPSTIPIIDKVLVVDEYLIGLLFEALPPCIIRHGREDNRQYSKNSAEQEYRLCEREAAGKE